MIASHAASVVTLTSASSGERFFAWLCASRRLFPVTHNLAGTPADVLRSRYTMQVMGRSTVMKLDSKISPEANSADMSLMFILGLTVGAAVPLLVLATG
jgi:hypothetical protein